MLPKRVPSGGRERDLGARSRPRSDAPHALPQMSPAVVAASLLTELPAKDSLILADNRLAEEAGWDTEILAIELQELIDLDFFIELTGFDMAEIDNMFRSMRISAGSRAR